MGQTGGVKTPPRDRAEAFDFETFLDVFFGDADALLERAREAAIVTIYEVEDDAGRR